MGVELVLEIAAAQALTVLALARVVDVDLVEGEVTTSTTPMLPAGRRRSISIDDTRASPSVILQELERLGAGLAHGQDRRGDHSLVLSAHINAVDAVSTLLVI
jgi:hypothetical protein